MSSAHSPLAQAKRMPNPFLREPCKSALCRREKHTIFSLAQAGCGEPALRPADGHQIVRIFVVSIGITGVQFQSPVKLLLRSCEIPVEMQLGQRQRRVALWRALIFFDSQRGSFLHFAPALTRRERTEEG